jgi:protein-S-isoprenylcysteine O-methyltransferase
VDPQSSLAFGAGVAYVLVFWVTYALWLVAELVLNTRQLSGSTSQKHDRGSFRLLFWLISIAISLDFGSALFLPSLRIASARETLFVVGICCVVAGTALRWWAVFTLGRYFTVDVATQAAQPVIEYGPYRYVRHPAYSGVLLALFGFGLSLGNWAGLLAMLVLPGAAFAYRIAVEEAALRSELGEPYERYISRTRRLIPYLL